MKTSINSMNTHTKTITTSTNDFTITAEVPYYVPQAGDTIYISGNAIVLTENMKPRHMLTYSKERGIYNGEPMKTTDGTNRVVFQADGFTWRQGDDFDVANNPTVEKAIKWSESDEPTLYVMDNFNVFSCGSPEFARIESVMAEMINA
jgi:hypothetical protein